MKDNMNQQPREKLGSRLGFLLLSAGCAIGLGNVWKFPYMAGQYGGGFFVLLYFVFLAIMGLPVMTMEFAMGRAAQKSPTKLYQELEPKGSKWHIHGYFSLVGSYLLMMFYTVVTGWIIQYFVKTVSGSFNTMSSEEIGSAFGQMLGDPWMMLICTFAVIVCGFFLCSFSLQKGLEKITKWMMLALLAIMVGLAVASLFTAGAAEGLKFYLLPDLGKMKEIGIGNVVVGAMTQAFFTLSLGMGSMAIFGSYLNKDRALLGESVRVACLDTFVAITSGLIIFPACFTYGVEVDSGPNLIFVTLPNIFNNLPMGQLFGSLFFLFISFAALSTVFAVFENIVACTRDLFGWSKKRACLYNCIAMLILAMPCIFGFNLLSFIQPFGEGSGIMDLEDFLVSNLILPIGSLIFALFCSHRYGWGWNNFLGEANTGKGLKMPRALRVYCGYILPVIIFVLLVVGIVQFFA